MNLPKDDGAALNAAISHERETLRVALGESWWCARGLWYHLSAPLRVVPLCRLGWHDWCYCCSPVNCDAG